jgi:hypothetical protein
VLYSSLNIVRVIKSRRMRWAGCVACMGEGKGVYRVWVGTPVRDHWGDLSIGGRITLIKMDCREIGIDGANWIWLVQDRIEWWDFVNMVMNLWAP